MTKTFDVVIAGGGPAASAAALTLARHGLSCAIIERRDDVGAKPGESLPPSARPLLEQLGIEELGDEHLRCHGNRSIWGSQHVDELLFELTPYGHGWHLDRRRFERLLIDRALDAGATRMIRTHVEDFAREGDAWKLTLNSGELRARFLLDATGRASALARRLGVHRIHDDAQIAHVWFLITDDEPDRDSFTLVESERDGWWYSAVLPQRQLTIAFMTDPGTPAPALPPQHTRERLAARNYRVTTAMTVDAGGSRLERVTGDGWAAIGDAAAAWDPLSSYGITAALATGMHVAHAFINNDFARYEQEISTMWNAYSDMRRDYYALETRWPESSYWMKRAKLAHVVSEEKRGLLRQPETAGRITVHRDHRMAG
jgi:flavin-dependent dehydrogenase